MKHEPRWPHAWPWILLTGFLCERQRQCSKHTTPGRWSKRKRGGRTEWPGPLDLESWQPLNTNDNIEREHFGLVWILRTSNEFPRPPIGSDLADTGRPEPQNYGDPSERSRGNRGPGGPWDKNNAIHNRADGNKVERDGSGDRCANEPQSKRLGSPHCPVTIRSVRLGDRVRWSARRTQDIVQDNVDGGDENDDASGRVKQALGLEVPPGDIIKPVRR